MNRMTLVPKLWGSEETLVNNELYCAKYLNLKPGHKCSLHYHKIKDETFFVVKGMVQMEYNGFVCTLEPRVCIRIHPGDMHRFWTDEPNGAQILEISTHDEATDSYRLENSQ